MKLLIATTYVSATNMRSDLLKTAVARGHDVILAAPTSAAEMLPAARAVGASYRTWSVSRATLDPVGDLRAVVGLGRIIRREKPAVVLLSQIKAVLVGAVATSLTRPPTVATLVNGLGTTFDTTSFGASRKAHLVRRAYGLALRAMDKVVFQNSDDPRLLQSLGLLADATPWSVVPGSGVDIERFVRRSAPPTTPTFVLVSRLLVSKGIRDFARAAELVKRSHPRARFLLVGTLEAAGHPDAIAQEEVSAWVRSGTLEYLGRRDDIPKLLSDATAFVLPSYYREGIPRTNLEALAVGLPIITTDSVGCKETVVDGVNGFVVPPRDPAAIAARVTSYITSPELVWRHGSASREIAVRTFDVRVVSAALLDAIGL